MKVEKGKRNLKRYESVVFILVGVVVLGSTLASASSINCTVSILPEKPDLSISSSDLSVSPAHPLINEMARITASVHNIGRAPATNVTVTFYLDKNCIATRSCTVAARSREEIAIAWTATNRGLHELTVELDEEKVLDELNETNNQARRSLLVTEPLALSLSAAPAIIEADGIETSIITALLTDERGNVVNGSLVTFSTNLGRFVSSNMSTASNVTIDGIATATLRSSTSAGTARVEGRATINGTAISDTISVVCKRTATAETDKTIENTTTSIKGTEIKVTETTITIEKGVLTINTTLENALLIAGNATAGSVISLPVEGGALEITLEEDARAANETVVGDIRTIKLDTPQEEYITSQPAIGTASVDLDVEFQGTFTPDNLAFETTLWETYDDLPLPDPSKLKETLAAHFGLDASEIANSTPIVVHAELFATNLTAADVTGVPVSITVSREWFATVAGGDPSRVTICKLNGTTGAMESGIRMTSASVTPHDGTVTFSATFDHFSVFALVAQPVGDRGEVGGDGGDGGMSPPSGGSPSLPQEITIPIANPGINIFNFEWLGLAITKVSVDLKRMTFNAQAALKKTDKPPDLPDPDGLVYGYFEITTNLEPENLRSARVYFRVSTIWMATNGVDVERIKLCRCAPAASKRWEELATTKIKEDGMYSYFSADMHALSLFSITGEKSAELPPPAPATPTPSMPSPTPVSTFVSPTPALAQVPPAPVIQWIVIIVAIVASAITVSVAYLLLRRIGA
ncbi:MAG: PGF-pre-PGF domain-containing protein [Methanophagales archaeon ANME-1-THS]|nr:MAG: PGF-pre-PGF domain-containing protein [Methanophagales archaeon ANME-1-THS]